MPLLAILLDLLLGDPPNRFHPTAWMGNFIGWLMRCRWRPHGNRVVEFMFGIFVLLVGLTLTTSVGLVISFLANLLPIWAGVLLTAIALKLTVSLRGLDHAAREIQSALETKNLAEARRLLSWHLVSRDTSQLDATKVSAAAIESVAENASDGIIAPLFFFAIGGLPAAFAYRFVNTADSMLGYHDEEREWLGKVPARLDDLLNFIPARLAGLFIVLSAPFCGTSISQAWKIMWRDSRQTASPNAGVPMSAMAGALGVELEKINHYALGKGLRLPISADLARARRMLYFAVGFAGIVFALFNFAFLILNSAFQL
jgi:adenosylcobinamide-phosphate synthase